MSGPDKETPAAPGGDVEPEDQELTLEDLGVVFGGWHPAPPEDDPLRSDGSS